MRPWEGEDTNGALPLMAVVHPTKNKIRSVLDFRELNEHVSCYTSGEAANVFGENLRIWRRMTGATTIVALKSAYLQLHVSEKLWKYQLVRYKGRV